MNRSFRNLLLIFGIVQGIVGIAFALRVPVVSQLWLSILPGATPHSLSFVGSIFAAAGASTVWCLAIANEDAAVTGLTLDYLTILIPVSIFAFQLASTEGGTPLLIFTVACVVGVILGAICFRSAAKSRIAMRSSRRPSCESRSESLSSKWCLSEGNWC
jgi:hypothetical protein